MHIHLVQYSADGDCSIADIDWLVQCYNYTYVWCNLTNYTVIIASVATTLICYNDCLLRYQTYDIYVAIVWYICSYSMIYM